MVASPKYRSLADMLNRTCSHLFPWRDRLDEGAVQDTLAVIAERVNRREGKREDQLRHAREQGNDLIRAREMCSHGTWEPWVRDNLDIGLTQTKAYIRFALESSVTDDFETQWECWQRVQGNVKPVEPDDGTPEPETPGPSERPPEGDEPPVVPKIVKLRPPLRIDRDRLPALRIDLEGEPLDVPEGEVMTDSHYDRVIGDRDVNVYRPDGSLLLSFRKRALKSRVCRIAHPGLRRAARWSEHRQAESGTVGYFDKPEPRATEFTASNTGEWARVVPLFRALDRVFRRVCPGPYARQLAAVAETNRRWVISDTVFTTGTVNRSVEFPAHRDRNNLNRSFAALTAFRSGQYTGGLLVFPRWHLAVDLTTRDVLLADTVTEPHGVTPLVGEPDEFERISVVAYFREGLANLP